VPEDDFERHMKNMIMYTALAVVIELGVLGLYKAVKRWVAW